MDKKQLILTLAILALVNYCAFAYVEPSSYWMDLNNDGNKEIIKPLANPNSKGQGMVTVSTIDKKPIGSFSMPNRISRVEFVSLNKDGNKQIVAWSHGKDNYTNLAIYGLRNNNTLVKIFEAGSGSGIKADFDSNPPKIRAGWEIWAWDGNNFNKQ